MQNNGRALYLEGGLCGCSGWDVPGTGEPEDCRCTRGSARANRGSRAFRGSMDI
jgi:hypothetical protein